MLVVDDVVADLEVVVEVLAPARPPGPAVDPAPAGEVGLGHHRQLEGRQHEPLLDRGHGDPGSGPDVGLVGERGDDALVGQGPADPLGRTRAVGGEHDAVAAVEKPPDPPGESRRVAMHALDRRPRDVGGVGPVGGRQHRPGVGPGVAQQPIER